MDPKPDKVLVTNVTALKKKYGAAGYKSIEKSVEALITADKQRGLVTALIPLDDKTAMAALSAPAVTRATDPAQNKKAVDAIFRKLAPDYVVLLGAIDVVPHQDMVNPVHDPTGEDNDKFAYGDLPYACEAPYSQEPEDFIGPTRVVGRLPDITGGSDPQYLIGLLQVAANYKHASPSDLRHYFAITAEIWSQSTHLSVTNTFGAPATVQSVPPGDYQWSQSQLDGRLHFFNCHGAPRSSQFYGQPKSGANVYPPALDAAYIDGKLAAGTIAAAECCYGGELYSLSATQKQIGICNVYLKNGAYGFLGSTTIAYGPESGNGQADLLCQYFLQNVLRGSSLGRAALEARQTFVRKSSPTDPSDLKTLAQFNLYGDPSLTPIQSPQTFAMAHAADFLLAEKSDRQDRRRLLFREGLDLAAKEPVPQRTKRKPKKTVLDQLHESARRDGKAPGAVLSFTIKHRKGVKLPRVMVSDSTLPTAFYVLFAKPEQESRLARRDSGVVDIVAFVGREVNEELVSITKIRSR